MSAFFDATVNARVRSQDLIDIEKIVEKDAGEKYDSSSHFIRVAVLKLIKQEKGEK